MTEPVDTPATPAGPNAPSEHKLPSGITVTLRSHRTLRRPDIQAVWRSVTDPDLFGPQQHDALVMMLVVGCSDERFPVPLTPQALDLFDGDDYIALYTLVNDAYRLVNGLSVLPRPDDYQDPKAPTTESNDSAPDSRVTPSSPSPETTGTISPTTSISTALEDGPRP